MVAGIDKEVIHNHILKAKRIAIPVDSSIRALPEVSKDLGSIKIPSACKDMLGVRGVNCDHIKIIALT